MSPIWITEGESNDYPLAPEGLHLAVCCDVVDLGEVESTYAGKTKRQRKVRLFFQLEDRDENDRRFVVVNRYTASLYKEARLRKDLQNWRGRKFTEEELKKFDLENVIGKPCQLQIMHNTNGEKTYANITSIIPAPRGTDIAVEDYVRVKDRENSEPPPHSDSDAPPDDDIPF